MRCSEPRRTRLQRSWRSSEHDAESVGAIRKGCRGREKGPLLPESRYMSWRANILLLKNLIYAHLLTAYRDRCDRLCPFPHRGLHRLLFPTLPLFLDVPLREVDAGSLNSTDIRHLGFRLNLSQVVCAEA